MPTSLNSIDLALQRAETLKSVSISLQSRVRSCRIGWLERVTLAKSLKLGCIKKTKTHKLAKVLVDFSGLKLYDVLT